MRYRMFIILAFVLCIAGCKGKKVQEDKFIDSDIITITPPSQQLLKPVSDISNLIDSVKYIKLELTDESIIGYIEKIVIYKEKIYILDTQTESLFVFDINGNYLFKISQIGRGPEDYIQVDFFDIDPHNDNIVLTDLMGYFVMIFDKEGKFISRRKIPFWVEGFSPFEDNGTILVANYRNNKHKLGQEFNLLYMDSLMQINKAYFPYNSSYFEKRPPSPSKNGYFYYYNNNPHYYPYCGSSIYKVDRNGLIMKYNIDFGENSFDLSYLSKGREYLNDYLSQGNFYHLGTVLETDEYLYFSYGKSLVASSFYSKKSGKTFDGYVFITNNIQFEGMPIDATYNSWFVKEIRVESLMSWKKRNENDELKDPFFLLKMDLAKTITIEDNPILKLFKLKSF